MSEYISKEDISRVLSERIGANKSCLIKAKEKGLHETEQYFNNLLFEDEQTASLIEELTSADVRPNIHGHWELEESDNSVTCDKCSCSMYLNDIMNGDGHFCPNCGCCMNKEK